MADRKAVDSGFPREDVAETEMSNFIIMERENVDVRRRGQLMYKKYFESRIKSEVGMGWEGLEYMSC